MKKIKQNYILILTIIIIASHIKEDVFELADVVYKFDDGKVEICNK